MATVASNGAVVAHSNPQNYLVALNAFLRNEPYRFLQPTSEHQSTSVAAVKAILDPLANNVAQAQTARQNEARRKRKRGSDEVEDPVLQLRQVYTNGLGVKQVWEQARRILDAACAEVERGIEEHLPGQKLQQDDVADAEVDSINGGGSELDGASDDEGMNFDGEVDADGAEGSAVEDEEILDDIVDDEDIAQDSDNLLSDQEDDESVQQSTFKQDPNKLNDGFFSIDDFNKQSQFLEQMDARGEDDNPSDEDEIDWDADPLSQVTSRPQSTKPSRSLLAVTEEGESDSDEGGPTFGNVDLAAADSGSDADMDNIEEGELDGMMSGLANTNEIRYTDFFEPPPRKPSKAGRTRALPKTQPPDSRSQANAGNVDEEDVDLERAMADVRRDLLDSEGEEEEMDDEDEDTGMTDDENTDVLPRLSSKIRNKNLSTHEKQQLQIAEEIRRLESLNVSKKSWTLSGEASAQARPINSLIEEDFEFERTGKPVPVITAEVSNDIEALIKRRILARDFDEVVRRRPTTLDAASDARRGRANVVVDDNKPTTSLGEMYENEYQRNTDPTSYVDKLSAAAKKQHEEIDRLWKEVRDQLDVLGNLHMKPKRAEIEIKTVEDKPRIAMEDARPTGTGVDEDGTMLAPQEIYRPGVDSRADKGEVLNGKSGASRSKEEMTREEKTRRRRREKERQKKATHSQVPGVSGADGKASKKSERETVLKDLQKGGVKVIDRKKGLIDLSTKKKGSEGVDGTKGIASGSSLKL